MKKVININIIYLYINIVFIELCCSLCFYMKFHEGHRVLIIDGEELLKKENISIENTIEEYDEKIDKLNTLKN